MITCQDEIDEIKAIIKAGDSVDCDVQSQSCYLEALAKTQLLLLCEIANKFSELK